MKNIKIDLEDLLARMKISRYELSKRTGIKFQTIDNYYKNQVIRYDSSILLRICIALDCSIEEVIKINWLKIKTWWDIALKPLKMILIFMQSIVMMPHWSQRILPFWGRRRPYFSPWKIQFLLCKAGLLGCFRGFILFCRNLNYCEWFVKICRDLYFFRNSLKMKNLLKNGLHLPKLKV